MNKEPPRPKSPTEENHFIISEKGDIVDKADSQPKQGKFFNSKAKPQKWEQSEPKSREETPKKQSKWDKKGQKEKPRMDRKSENQKEAEPRGEERKSSFQTKEKKLERRDKAEQKTWKEKNWEREENPQEDLRRSERNHRRRGRNKRRKNYNSNRGKLMYVKKEEAKQEAPTKDKFGSHAKPKKKKYKEVTENSNTYFKKNYFDILENDKD